MYETAIPNEIRQQLAEMEPARIVVGLPSYRNVRTVGPILERLATALHQQYAAFRPLIVHADGHSLDETLPIAAHVPLPPTVRRLATRYQGLPGKGSALRAIFEVATVVQAQAIALVEADVSSLTAEWLSRLLTPILSREAEMVLPLYPIVRPPLPSADLIVFPLLTTLFNLPIRHPTGGEVALAGGVATFFAERDVWETDVARAGVDVWMPVQVALGGGRLVQVPLGPKIHHTPASLTLAEAKFLQEVGTLFRMGHLHERVWREQETPPRGVPLLPGDPLPPRHTPNFPDALGVWRMGKRAIKTRLAEQWESVLAPAQQAAVAALLHLPDEQIGMAERLWARVVYDFLVVYNLGEGDPDKVVLALYPLLLLRHAALLAEAARHSEPALAREQLIQRQAAIFQEEFDYLLQRWARYISPEQADIWRELGISPG